MNSTKLPPHPNLGYYKNRARDLLKEAGKGQLQPLQEILQRVKRDHPRLGRLANLELQGGKLQLTDIQFILARDYGFESWPKFARHIENVSRADSATAIFESAADAVVAGDVAKLQKMLRQHPELVRERSGRLHHATLLNYVGANGVENYRQKTPANAVKVAEILLAAGADVKAKADIYGGSDTLGLAATSVFPAKAGVQEALLDILIKHGADLGGKTLVNACLANGRGRAAEHLAKHNAPLDVEGAAGVGRLDLVKAFCDGMDSFATKPATKSVEYGFMWACEYGRADVVRFLLKRGLNVGIMPRGETGLHWAAFAGHPDVVRELLKKDAPLDLKDKRFDSTPLAWALHGWGDPPLEVEPKHYYEVVKLLVAAGATVDEACRKKASTDPRMLALLKK